MTKDEYEIAQDRIQFFGFFQATPTKNADLSWFMDKRSKAGRLFSEPGLFQNFETFAIPSATDSQGFIYGRILIAYPSKLDYRTVLNSKLFKYTAELVAARFNAYVYQASKLNIEFPHSEPLENYSTIVFVEKQWR